MGQHLPHGALGCGTRLQYLAARLALVLVARRRIEALDELNEAELRELGALIRRVSQALKAAAGCRKTYVVQFAEAAEHPRAHFHLIPRMAA